MRVLWLAVVSALLVAGCNDGQIVRGPETEDPDETPTPEANPTPDLDDDGPPPPAPNCVTTSETPGAWMAHDFATATSTSCSGARYVRWMPEYQMYVGVALCGSSTRYKLFMAPSQSDTFLEVTDGGGHGQDHCELVNDAFSISNDDDINSGSCSNCALGDLLDPIGTPAYFRYGYGECFESRTTVDWADLTTPWYECGVAIP